MTSWHTVRVRGEWREEIRIARGSAVYVFQADGRTIYVGSTSHLGRRLHGHTQLLRLLTAISKRVTIKYKRVSGCRLCRKLERRLIYKIQPPANSIGIKESA